ncbi:MAG: hypothetical protein IJA63_11380 [Akkermansia sp.]|nr:hypothetical protein [Akkermansia sp.]
MARAFMISACCLGLSVTGSAAEVWAPGGSTAWGGGWINGVTNSWGDVTTPTGYDVDGWATVEGKENGEWPRSPWAPLRCFAQWPYHTPTGIMKDIGLPCQLN